MHKLGDIFLQDKMDKRTQDNLFRELALHEGKIDFSSNDYLGFSRLESLRTHTISSASGATGSRLISGHTAEAEAAEKKIADFHGTDAALIFNCGYMANIGLFSCLAEKGDTWIADAYIHASILDGMRLSYAQRYKFGHNDMEDLEKKLKLATGRKFVAVESIYSMDGDEAPLKTIVDLCKQYNAFLIVDEAHATGIYGQNGEGLVTKYGLQKDVLACVYTFGKALGLHGAAITGSENLRHYLINYARPFIYSTALPPYAYRQIQQAYHELPGIDRVVLFDLIHHFRHCIQKMDSVSFLDSQSQIQGILIGDNKKTKDLSDYLYGKGIYAKAILSPTVPKGKERLRICLHTFNTEEDIELLMEEIKTFLWI